jgi:hypothetical protein
MFYFIFQRINHLLCTKYTTRWLFSVLELFQIDLNYTLFHLAAKLECRKNYLLPMNYPHSDAKFEESEEGKCLDRFYVKYKKRNKFASN